MPYDPPELMSLFNASFDAVIDARSPAEFAEDHLPDAINLPVLSDEERARVGTIYVQQSPFDARKLGAALVARNVAMHLDGPLAQHPGGWRPLIYCWRGGQRSGAFASILHQIGWQADVLKGGYKAYRRMIVQSLYEDDFRFRMVLLDGNTGTAKTALLHHLPKLGVQTLDLEGLARHRGSALGAQGAQPSQKAFESALAKRLSEFDPSSPIVVEAESSRIGKLNLPPKVFDAMRGAPRIVISAPVRERARYLCAAYSDVVENADELIARLGHLTRLRGKAQVEVWAKMARSGAHQDLAESLIKNHYDPAYAKARGVALCDVEDISVDRLDSDGIAKLAEQVADVLYSKTS